MFGLLCFTTSCHTFSRPKRSFRSRFKAIDLKAYKEEHYRILRGLSPSRGTLKDLLKQAETKRILLIGDIHNNRNLHEKIFGLLKRWIQVPSQVFFFVEFLGLEDKKNIHRLEQGELSIHEFADAVFQRWKSSWLQLQEFDPPFYWNLLRLMNRRRIHLRPMEPIPRLPLGRRDQCMARTLIAFRKKRPNALIIVLVGHTHLLGKGHLADLLGGTPGFPLTKDLPILLPEQRLFFPGPDPIGKAGPSWFLWNPST